MVGGMALAGTLIGSGAVTATSALLSDAPQVVVETEVLRRMAHADARKRLCLPQDPSDWLLLSTMESQIASALHQLQAFGDEDSSAVTELYAKAKLLRRAIAWMLDRGLGTPAVTATD